MAILEKSDCKNNNIKLVDKLPNNIILNNTICSICGNQNTECVEFCEFCSYELLANGSNIVIANWVICPFCSYQNPDGTEFCDACGYDFGTNLPAIAVGDK